MSPLRFVAIVVYVGYLVNIGLLMIVLPWSEAWGVLLTLFPVRAAAVLGEPWLRGLLSGFGVLHLLLVLWEIAQPTLLTPLGRAAGESQDPSGP